MSQLNLLAPTGYNLDGRKRNDFGFKQIELTAQLIPDRLSLEPGHRWQIVAENGGCEWQFPIQFTKLEARWLLQHLEALDCWDFDDRGVPIEVRRIHAVIESLDDRKGGINSAIASQPLAPVNISTFLKARSHPDLLTAKPRKTT